MKQFVLLSLFIVPLCTKAQDLDFLGFSWNEFENLESRYHKPNLEKHQKLIRTKYKIVNTDTISQSIDLEIFSYHDRFVQLRYLENGTLDDKTTVIFVPPNLTTTIYEYQDEDLFEIDSTFKTYNRYNLLEDCITNSYSFDTLRWYGKSRNYYDSDSIISKIEYFDLHSIVTRKDTFIYNSDGYIDSIYYYSTSNQLSNFVVFYRNKWAKYKLYEINYYNADSTLTRRIIVPGNPRYPQNTCIIKAYSPPMPDSPYSVATTEIETIPTDDVTIAAIIKTSVYRDHKFTGANIKTYDRHKRIIKEEYIDESHSMADYKTLYSYTVTKQNN